MHVPSKLVMNCESEKVGLDSWLLKTPCLPNGYSLFRGLQNEYQLTKELWRKEPVSS